MMKCKEIREELLEAAITNLPLRPEVRKHFEGCPSCRHEVESMRSTMALLETWEAPEPSPFFDTRFNARLRAEAEAAPAGWRERIKAAIFSLRDHPLGWRPVTVVALAIAMVGGVGIYQSSLHPAKKTASLENGACAVVDLQALDNNQQLLNEMSILDDTDNSE